MAKAEGSAPHWKRRHYRACKRGDSPARQAWLQYDHGVINRNQLDAMRDWITLRACCSATWGSDLWQRGVEYPPGGPGGTRMCRCAHCRRYMPPQYVMDHGQCLDCRILSLGLDVLMSYTNGSHSVMTIYEIPNADRAYIRRGGRSAFVP